MKSIPSISLYGIIGATLVYAAVALAGEPKPLNVPGADWHAKAERWFTSKDEKERKAQMKEASRALKRPCKNCHTEDFEGFIDEDRKVLTQQMMSISFDSGLQCKDCHDGKEKMTELGETAEKMYDLSREKGVYCDECHQTNQSMFKDLSEKGKKFKDEMEAKKKAAGGAAPATTPASAPASTP